MRSCLSCDNAIKTFKSLKIPTAQSGADLHATIQFESILGNSGNPSHVISDVVEHVEVCLQMVPVLCIFELIKSRLKSGGENKKPSFQRVSRLRTKMAVARLTIT